MPKTLNKGKFEETEELGLKMKHIEEQSKEKENKAMGTSVSAFLLCLFLFV
jgi:hypothetical protein